MSVRCRPAIAICLTIFAASALACGGSGPKQGPTSARSQGAQPKAGFEAILSAFRQDEDEASSKYKGKIVVAAGAVQSAEQADPKSKGPHVLLLAGPKRDTVAAFFTGRDNDAALALKPGQQARIKGTILSGSRYENGTVLLALDDCQLVN